MKPAAAVSRPDWEIFCKVVDNYGDIGVCWRLARALAAGAGFSVRLWVDDWAAFARLCPDLAGADGEVRRGGIEVRRWTDPFPEVEPAAVVIEAFACDLPDVHLRAMAGQPLAPVWINLEYLSAEGWVAGCHRLASPHPALPLVKHFFFPGFDADTGGLIREAGLLAERDAFRAGDGRAAWFAAQGMALPSPDTLVVSLFAYEQPALAELVAAWAQGERPVLLLVPEGRVLGDLAAAVGMDGLAPGARLQRGQLALAVLPFTDQAGYDRLLWACDLNFVRGEDSFVRAQWAAHPFVWQIYLQDGDAHVDKLDAFVARWCAGLEAPAAAALRRFWSAWNGAGGIAAAWPDFAAALPALAAHARDWCGRLAAQDDLVMRLTQFCNHIRAVKR